MFKFKKDKSFIVRHKILEYLYNNQNCIEDEQVRIGSIDITTNTKIPINEIHKYHQLLKKTEEIDCCEENGHHRMFITQEGCYAYLENKYTKEAHSDLWEFYYHPLKVIIPVIAVIFSGIVLWFNLIHTSKIQRLQNQVDQIEKHIIEKEKIMDTMKADIKNISKNQ